MGGVVGLAAIIVIIFIIVQRRSRNKNKDDVEAGESMKEVISQSPSYELAVPMLKNIVVQEELGSGKFGKVSPSRKQ